MIEIQFVSRGGLDFSIKSPTVPRVGEYVSLPREGVPKGEGWVAYEVMEVQYFVADATISHVRVDLEPL